MDIITESSPDHPKIIWDDLQTQLLEQDSEERMTVYVCRGFCERGIEYAGIATFFCGELHSIEDIELIDVFG